METEDTNEPVIVPDDAPDDLDVKQVALTEIAPEPLGGETEESEIITKHNNWLVDRIKGLEDWGHDNPRQLSLMLSILGAETVVAVTAGVAIANDYRTFAMGLIGGSIGSIGVNLKKNIKEAKEKDEFNKQMDGWNNDVR